MTKAIFKLIISVVLFGLALMYIVGRTSVIMSQFQSNKGRTETSTTLLTRIPDDVIFAAQYMNTDSCEGHSAIRVYLTSSDQEKGRLAVESYNLQQLGEEKCNYHHGIQYQFKGDSIRFRLPNGANYNEIICPVSCRFWRKLPSSYFLPEYQDTLVDGIPKRMIKFPSYQIVKP